MMPYYDCPLLKCNEEFWTPGGLAMHTYKAHTHDNFQFGARDLGQKSKLVGTGKRHADDNVLFSDGRSTFWDA